MKPIKLRMVAFGPYKDEQLIDFRELKDNQLFVISGPTGSGKTTIFDAISYALYGHGSGSDRKNPNLLRSQFAAEDIHTSVDFTFEQHGVTYRIFRQLAHVKAGNKSPTGGKCEFYEILDGEAVPAVDRQHVTEINDKVRDLIGLTVDQFKQIVMLPQGEFRELLTSNTRNKEAILRQIFKTEKYEQLTATLRKKRSEEKEIFTTIEMQRDHYIDQISVKLPSRDQSMLFNRLGKEHYTTSQIITGLTEEISYYEQAARKMKENLKQAHEKHQEAQKDYHKKEALNKKFAEYEEKQADLLKLEAKKDEMKGKEETFNQAEKASQITPYENQVEEWKKTIQATESNLAKAKTTKEESALALKQAEENYAAEKAKESEREDLRKSLDELRKVLPVVKEIDGEKRALKQREKELQLQEASLRTTEETIEEKKKDLKKQREEMQKAEEKLVKLNSAHTDLHQALDAAGKLKQYIKLEEKFLVLKKEYKEKEKSYKALEGEFDKLEDVYLQNQAVLIASHLQHGEACPVCGSEEHPDPARVEGDGVSREMLDLKRQEVRQEKELFDQLSVKFQTLQSRMQEQERIVFELGFDLTRAKEEYASLVNRGKKLRAEYEGLKSLQDWLVKERQKYAGAETELEKTARLFQERRDDLQKARASLDKDRAVFQERLRSVPEELRDYALLKTRIEELDRQYKSLVEAWERADKNLQEAKLALTERKTNYRSLSDQLKDFEKKFKTAEESFRSQVSRANFVSLEQYLQAKMSEEARLALRRELEEYEQQVGSLSKQVSDLKKELAGKDRVDLVALAERVDHLRRGYEEALQKENKVKNILLEARDLKESLVEISERFKDQEKRYNLVENLYDLIRGENDRKISFERYLQIDYLERILEAANERLYDMSNGQYLLKHSERQESHGAQSGLALDVNDAYTGLDRDVKTLSGGEKFNASLCLALGVSDVIQSYQGNVVIDTMFIDEGFGSLDEETLAKAIETIIGLQETGRMIGVISHVNELKNAFPAVLQVEKTREGYSRAEFLVD